MPDRPVVSIIIPSRDCLARLPRAIASVGQVSGAEIVVLDDDSLDGSRDWLGWAAQSDARLRVLVGPGTGRAKARNMAIGAARGRLLAFLDADDGWHAGKLQAQLALHQDNPDLAFSFTDYNDIDAEGTALATGFAAWPWFRGRHAAQTDAYLLEDDALAQIYAEPVVATSTVVARTDLVRQLGGFDPTLPSTEDWDLWLRLAARGKVGCVPRVLADHLVHPIGVPNMRGRVIGMGMIAARHGAAAERLNPRASRIFTARLLTLDAEVATAANRRWRAAWLRAKAWQQVPTRAMIRAVVAALQTAMAMSRGVRP
jgi:glycosyltransferase involved in cell wall biosynthesis